MTDIRRKAKPNILFEENREAFNKMVAAGQMPDLKGQNLSDLNLRDFNLQNANLSSCYLRGADLGGLDLSGACLYGASLKNANVSGCLFPDDLRAEEIRMSLELGTRIRQVENSW